ncbi:phage holin family protein [Diaphorobacter sp.]|uniref:phage holin family protein n=1 Tax=Diaphorobacter sp. TaxID=1934310 RepID=UPI0028AB909A|nr:phage holin family protein [Diaphorobacter sp.]
MNLFALLGLEGFVARWRANVIEGAIAVEDRLELAGMEWGDQKRRLIIMALLAVAGAGLTVITFIMLSFAILVSYWDTPDRATVAWILFAVWAVLWAGAIIGIVMLGRRATNAFAVSKQVLARDWRNLKERL